MSICLTQKIFYIFCFYLFTNINLIQTILKINRCYLKNNFSTISQPKKIIVLVIDIDSSLKALSNEIISSKIIFAFTLNNTIKFFNLKKLTIVPNIL